MKAVKTRWVVISGAPCSGKTTTIDALQKLGYDTVPETARLFIDQQLAAGHTIEQIRGDEGAFQRSLFKIKLEVESKLDPAKLIFLDRALPDSISYFRQNGIDPTPIWDECRRFHYQLILLFDRLPLKKDYARREDEKTATQLDQQLEADYRSLGLDVVRVPVMEVDRRLEFVIGQIQALR